MKKNMVLFILAVILLVNSMPALSVAAEVVKLHIRKGDNRLVAMSIDMPGQGGVEVLLDGYTAKCGADSDVFVCPLDEFSTAEVIDMR